MMNAADDSQLDDFNSSPTLLVDQTNKINSAFGLPTDPPKSNFLKEPTKIPDFMSKPLEIKPPTVDSKFSSDYLNKSPSISKPSITPPISPFNVSQAALIQPPAPVTIKQNSNLLLTSLALPQQMNTMIAPPIPVAVSQPPPLANSSFPGPPTLTNTPPIQTTTNGSTPSKLPSNPYSARGALNKKVYETQVTSVPVQSVNLPPPIQELKSPPPQTSNIYVPPPTTTLAESSMPEQNIAATTFMSPPPPPLPSSFIAPEQSFNIDSGFNLTQQVSSLNIDNTSNKQQQKNVWNWLTQNRLVNSLKNSVESVITTIDPQMKSYIHNENQHLNVLTLTTDRILSDSIRESFSAAGFLRLSVYEYNCQTTNSFALQIVSQAVAFQAIQEKMANACQQMQQDCVLVATQDFLCELSQNCWFDQSCIMIKDTLNKIDIVFYTEAIPVELELVQQLQQKTFANYAQRWSGFSSRLTDSSSSIEWYEMMFGLNRKSILINAFKSITSIYKYKLMSLQTNK